MATVYCAACAFMYTKGGVKYCGCPGCPTNGRSVSATSPKNCGYFRSGQNR
ncbi:MAG: hypothetical protein IKI97_10895 [Clostridia bacterium]|nr:hypothetical protein [Clostridia bacterium]